MKIAAAQICPIEQSKCQYKNPFAFNKIGGSNIILQELIEVICFKTLLV